MANSPLQNPPFLSSNLQPEPLLFSAWNHYWTALNETSTESPSLMSHWSTIFLATYLELLQNIFVCIVIQFSLSIMEKLVIFEQFLRLFYCKIQVGLETAVQMKIWFEISTLPVVSKRPISHSYKII